MDLVAAVVPAQGIAAEDGDGRLCPLLQGHGYLHIVAGVLVHADVGVHQGHVSAGPFDLFPVGVGAGVPNGRILRHDLPRGEAGADELHGCGQCLFGGVLVCILLTGPVPGIADLSVDRIFAVLLHDPSIVVHIQAQHRAGRGVDIPVAEVDVLKGRPVEPDPVVDQLQAVAGVHVDVYLTGGDGIAVHRHGGLRRVEGRLRRGDVVPLRDGLGKLLRPVHGLADALVHPGELVLRAPGVRHSDPVPVHDAPGVPVEGQERRCRFLRCVLRC